MNWRNILILSCSTVMLAVAARVVLLACTEDMTEYTRILFFLPENGKNIYSHWWFKQNDIYEDEVRLDSLPEDEDIIQLCKEWNDLLGGNLELKAIQQVVFGNDTIIDEKIVLKQWASPAVEKVLQALKKQPDLYRYLVEAKKIQRDELIVSHYNEWWYDLSPAEIIKKHEAYKQKGNQLLALANQVKGNKALYEKYLFQIIKLYAAGFDHEHLNACYNEFRKVRVSNTLQGWGILYYLSINSIDTISNNFLLAEALRLSPGKTKRCVELFVPLKDIRYMDSITNPIVKANLLSMQALHDFRPNANYLSSIATADPNNPLLMDLIGREINKYEDYKFTKVFTSHDILGHWTSKQKHEQSFKELLSTLTYLSSRKTSSPLASNYYCLALAHCKALAGKKQQAYALLKKVNTDHLPYKIQQSITHLYLLAEENLTNENVQDEIAREIMFVTSISKNNLNTKRCLSGILLKMHKALLAQNDVALGGLCLLKSNMVYLTDNYFGDYTWYELNATHEEYLALEHLIKQERKRPLQKLLTQGLTLPLIHDSRARMYMREQKFDSALVYLNKLPELFFIQQYNYLIRTSLFFKEENMPDKSLTVKEALSLLNQKIKNVESITDRNQKARQYLAIANALFELSNKGNYCYTTGYYSSNYPVRSAKEIQAKYPETFFDFYIKAKPAFDFYQKAREHSKALETDAAVQFHYMKAYDKIYESTQLEYREEMPKDGWIHYFKTYGNTLFYQTHSCPGIESYLEKAS